MTLEAVRDALLAEARADAAEQVAAADTAGRDAVDAAQAEADRLLAQARADGEAEARAAVAGELARARRQAREVVLAARRAAYEHVGAEARRQATELGEAPGGASLVEGLAALARAQLGDGAVVDADGEVGGVVARAGTRSVDYRLAAVAERCLDALGPEVEELWR